MLRSSSLFPLQHGDHACVFYRTEESLLEFLVPYVADGLHQGELIFGAQKPQVAERLLSGLRAVGIDTEDAFYRGALQLHTPDDVYFSRQRFDLHGLVNRLLDTMDKSLQSGFTGLRTAGDLSWAPNSKWWPKVMEYEHRVQHVFAGRSVTGVCQYHMEPYPSDVVEAVSSAHGFHLPGSDTGFSHSRMLARDQNYLVDYVADPRPRRSDYHFVVHRRHSDEIVGWGAAPTFSDARTRCESLTRQH